MWPFKSPKQSPLVSHDEVIGELRDALGELNAFIERLQQAETDITNLNTALNRIERKQSRWIELLNEKEDSGKVDILEGRAPSLPQGENTLPAIGDETLEEVIL